ncbi:hypothetical protein HK102_004771 [Quaeritorhiza haematococci]|nr:hypothetical protein HK102_004771 [Quaeritorhiza haematococci]
MDFHRAAQAAKSSQITARRVANMQTAYIDASHIYGANEEIAKLLRSFTMGMLRTTRDGLLPVAPPGVMDGRAPNLFLAGDPRANENPVLSSLHILFVREHNRRARELYDKFPLWSDEEIYQQARRWVIALIQHITINQYVPALLGSPLAPYAGYRPNVNPGVDSAFAATAFRYGHSAINKLILRLDEHGAQVPGGHLLLRDTFFNPQYVRTGGIDSILRGVVSQIDQAVDTAIVDDLRNHMDTGAGQKRVDLGTINIQRNRDFGLSSYLEMRKAYNLLELSNRFDEINSDPAIHIPLMNAYGGNISLVDPWIGGLAEPPVNGGILGELFSTIVADQFARTRDGDRLWFQAPGVLPADELSEVTTFTLSKVIQLNTNITAFPSNAFTFFEPASFSGDLMRDPGGDAADNATDDSTGEVINEGSGYSGRLTWEKFDIWYTRIHAYTMGLVVTLGIPFGIFVGRFSSRVDLFLLWHELIMAACASEYFSNIRQWLTQITIIEYAIPLHLHLKMGLALSAGVTLVAMLGFIAVAEFEITSRYTMVFRRIHKFLAYIFYMLSIINGYLGLSYYPDGISEVIQYLYVGWFAFLGCLYILLRSIQKHFESASTHAHGIEIVDKQNLRLISSAEHLPKQSTMSLNFEQGLGSTYTIATTVDGLAKVDEYSWVKAPETEISFLDFARSCQQGFEWTIIGGLIIDIGSYRKYHPGGSAVLTQVIGRDATEIFHGRELFTDCDDMQQKKYTHSRLAKNKLSRYVIGKIQSSDSNRPSVAGDQDQKTPQENTNLPAPPNTNNKFLSPSPSSSFRDPKTRPTGPPPSQGSSSLWSDHSMLNNSSKIFAFTAEKALGSIDSLKKNGKDATLKPPPVDTNVSLAVSSKSEPFKAIGSKEFRLPISGVQPVSQVSSDSRIHGDATDHGLPISGVQPPSQVSSDVGIYVNGSDHGNESHVVQSEPVLANRRVENAKRAIIIGSAEMTDRASSHQVASSHLKSRVQETRPVAINTKSDKTPSTNLSNPSDSTHVLTIDTASREQPQVVADPFSDLEMIRTPIDPILESPLPPPPPPHKFPFTAELVGRTTTSRLGAANVVRHLTFSLPRTLTLCAKPGDHVAVR